MDICILLCAVVLSFKPSHSPKCHIDCTAVLPGRKAYIGCLIQWEVHRCGEPKQPLCKATNSCHNPREPGPSSQDSAAYLHLQPGERSFDRSKHLQKTSSRRKSAWPFEALWKACVKFLQANNWVKIKTALTSAALRQWPHVCSLLPKSCADWNFNGSNSCFPPLFWQGELSLTTAGFSAALVSWRGAFRAPRGPLDLRGSREYKRWQIGS